jgi:penicillin-binding protein 2
MTELRNVEADLSRFRLRVLVISDRGRGLLPAGRARLVYLQVVRHEDLAEQAESNRTAVVPIVPNRGLILDRNGVVLATNYSAYTLEITPSRVADLEQTIDALSRWWRSPARPAALQEAAGGIQELRVAAHPHQADRRGSGPFRRAAIPLPRRRNQGPAVPQLPLWRTGQPRDRLHRPHQPGREGADGGLGPTRRGQLPRHRVHRQAGRGAELRAQLHGTTGVEEVETSAGGRAVRRLASTRPRPATPSCCPSTSSCRSWWRTCSASAAARWWRSTRAPARCWPLSASPPFDPNLFVDGIDQENWQMLNESHRQAAAQPRLRGTYPPGSTYKPFMALAALRPASAAQQIIQDPGYFMFGNHRFRSHGEGGLAPVDMYAPSCSLRATSTSTSLANEMGVDLIHDFSCRSRSGFGPDHRHRHPGRGHRLLPSTDWKRAPTSKPEQQKWYAGETISLGIGQGYNNFTMLQLALATGAQAMWPPARLAPRRWWPSSRTRNTTQRAWPNACVTTPCTWRLRRQTSRRSRWPWWWKTPVSVARWPHPLPAASSTTGCWGSLRHQKTWPRCRRARPDHRPARRARQPRPHQRPRALPRQRLPWQPPPRQSRPSQPRDIRCPKAPEPPMRCGSEASARRGMISAPFTWP